MLKKSPVMNFLIRREIGPEIKIDLPVEEAKLCFPLDSDVSKVNCAKSPLFFPMESLKTQLDKFWNGLECLTT